MPNLHAREIFAAGKHNGEPYTEKDLDDMVAAFSALDFVPALKQGHVKDETGLPALGYVVNLRRVGSKLIADFVDMPQEVYDAIKSKRFARVSAEVFHNFHRGGITFRRVLKAVALLGVEIPAVHGLKPLHEFAADSFDALTSIEFNSQEELNMVEESKIQAQLDALSTKLQALSDENAQLKAEKADADEKAKIFAAEVQSLKGQNIKAQVTAKLSALKVPALRDHFAALYSLSLGESKLLKFKEGETSAETIVDGLMEEINKAVAKLFVEESFHDDENKTGDASSDFDAEIKRYKAEHGCSYRTAMAAVREAKPELFKAYAGVA